MKFTHSRVFNFEGAIYGMRNPMNSWDKSDSYFGVGVHGDILIQTKGQLYEILYKNNDDCVEFASIGPNDMTLAKKLIAAGPEHRKFLRQIFVTVDIEAPIFWWKEFDTYALGITKNSTSTMHKLASTPIDLDCFETGDLDITAYEESCDLIRIEDEYYDGLQIIIKICEELRQKYNKTKDKKYWKELVRILPQGWLQTRTVTMNYENLLSICAQRKGHKLVEWAKFIDFAHTLPYANDFIFMN